MKLLIPSLLVLSLTACGTHSAEVDHGAPAVTVLRGDVEQVSLGSLSAKGLAQAQRAFGVDLLKAVCKHDGTGNTTVSPASAALALGLLDAGARGETRAKVDALLHLPAWSPAVVAAYQAQHASLASLKDVQLSNRVYSQVGAAPQRQTLNDVATGFDASLAKLNFAELPQASVDAINKDVDHDTHGKITKLFDQPLDPTTTTVLTNAIHLKATWEQRFSSTQPAPFTKDDGTTETVPMMAGEVFGDLRTSAGWQSAELPYQGSVLEAFAILPPTHSTCGDLTAPLLDALVDGPSSVQAGVQMPTVDLAQKHELTDVLGSLGLPEANADYSGFGHGEDSIGEAVQKVTLKVDENGSEAAAATGIGVTATSARASMANLLLDRPYLLLLQDKATGTPLFLARVADPTAKS